MHCSRWLAMLCMDPGNCKEWKEAHGDDAQAPLICQPADSNQCNSRHPGLGGRASCKKTKTLHCKLSCGCPGGLVGSPRTWVTGGSCERGSFGAEDSGDACHRPRITGGTDAHWFEADLQESFLGCQVVHSFDGPKMFWQYVRIADKNYAFVHS